MPAVHNLLDPTSAAGPAALSRLWVTTAAPAVPVALPEPARVALPPLPVVAVATGTTTLVGAATPFSCAAYANGALAFES